MQRLDSVEQIIEKYAVTSDPIKSKIYVSFGCLFVFFAIIGVFGARVAHCFMAVPAAFLFSISNERLFRWSLTNSYFGSAIFEYYATGKTIPKHAKIWDCRFSYFDGFSISIFCMACFYKRKWRII